MIAARHYPAAVVGGSGIYLFANLFALPGTPFLLGGDQVLFWTNAQRMLHGELIYRDFLEFTPPGTDSIYLGAFELLGSRIAVPNLVVLVLGVSLCWLCFYIARFFVKPAHAALAAALFVVLDYGKLLNGTHHWFSMLAVMGAVAVLLGPRTLARTAIAGGLLGVATFFTQTKGPVAALGVGAYLVCEQRQTCAKHLLALLLALILTWTALSTHFIAKVGLGSLWYFQATYLLKYVAHGPHSLTSGPLASFLIVCLTVPVVYAVSLWKSSGNILLLALVGLALFVEAVWSPNWIRLYCVVMPAIILFVRLALVRPALLWTGVMCIAGYQIGARHLQQTVVADLPAGRVTTTAANAGKLLWLAGHTTPGELLFEARWVDMYFPLALRNPVFTDMLEGGHDSRPEFVDRSIQQLEAERVRYIIWSPRLESPVYPFAKFHDFLTARYERVATFPDEDQVWERK